MTYRQMEKFQRTVRNFYIQHKRDLPWRRTTDPYRIWVSEVMLQQTQVPRVIAKYREFVRLFPTAAALSRASARDVLAAWQGLGYYRRALMLHRAAGIVSGSWRGKYPRDSKAWQALPGIGHNTAAAICAYAFNEPAAFIETNIRKVFIHHFFKKRNDVSDAEILPLVAETLDQKDPRQWYWALMDYGSHLAKVLPNPARQSKHHVRQSQYHGSFRQLRAQVLRLAVHGSVSLRQIVKHTGRSLPEADKAVQILAKEGFLKKVNGKVMVI